MHVSAAFLNGELEEEIYLSQPPGFIIQQKENFVCKLKKSLYGLKQSPRCWNNSFDQFMKELGFTQTASDSCIYIKDNQNIFPCTDRHTFPSQCLSGTILLTSYSMVWDWRVSLQGQCFFIGLSCLILL